MARADRPPPPLWMVQQVADIMAGLPETREEDAWIGVRWRVRQATVVHLFGGEDQLFRLVFRGLPGEVLAFEHMGHPYFRAPWGSDMIGMVVDENSDWTEVTELLTDSYCLMAPKKLAAQVFPPPAE